MKFKVIIAVLAVACIGLGIAFFSVSSAKKQADEQHVADVSSINVFSNQLAATSKHVDDLNQVNLTLSNDLLSAQQQVTSGGEQLTQLSNSLTAASAALVDAKASLSETKTSLASAQEQVVKLNIHITDLDARNKALDDQVDSMSNELAQLTAQIEDTKSQLASTKNQLTDTKSQLADSQTNAAFLDRELQKQLAQKVELEHKFNDIVALRAQVKKIQDEMFVTRRLQLMKYDTGGKKGAELLVQHNWPAKPSVSKQQPVNYDLNVEVGSDGSVRVIPPLGGTNSPAH